MRNVVCVLCGQIMHAWVQLNHAQVQQVVQSEKCQSAEQNVKEDIPESNGMCF